MIAAETVDFASGGEEEDIGVGLRVLDELHGIPADGLHASDAFAAAMLSGEGIVIDALDIAVPGKGDDDVLLRDEVFVIDIGCVVGDLGETVVPEFLFEGSDFFDKELNDVVARGEQAIVFSDIGFKGALLGEELILFHALQTTEGHGENRIALRLGKPKASVEPGARFRIVFRVADDVNDLIDVIVSEDQAIDDVEAVRVAF